MDSSSEYMALPSCPAGAHHMSSCSGTRPVVLPSFACRPWNPLTVIDEALVRATLGNSIHPRARASRKAGPWCPAYHSSGNQCPAGKLQLSGYRSEYWSMGALNCPSCLKTPAILAPVTCAPKGQPEHSRGFCRRQAAGRGTHTKEGPRGHLGFCSATVWAPGVSILTFQAIL